SMTEYLRQIRPPVPRTYERRFETGAGVQAQVDFAEFQTVFTNEPGVVRKVWLFSMVLGHSRWLWGRFCPNQGLETVMRCHIAAFEAMAGCCTEILYDRMKTAVIGEDAAGVVTYNASLVALLAHYGSAPKACKPYRAKTKGKVERPFRYIRQDFFLGRSFRDLEDLTAQFAAWCG
ncbi:IS21 family transposase, partial [Klebsiella pneumoniae]|uniref:IS21 family transposase n=1 Tax=Klebsiella pneumoniae TaxID=573 RepID=UPI003A854931